MMNFTAIDFETAHANIPCEVGLCVVRDGEISETRSWLIKPHCFPYMNFWNQKIHGISNEMLGTADAFDSLWYNDLKPYLQKEFLVAHNAPFDIGVLRATLRHYEISAIDNNYVCSCQISKKIWSNLPKHGLGFLCEYMDIKFSHHRAGADAEACAKLMLIAAKEINAGTLADLISNVGLNVKKM